MYPEEELVKRLKTRDQTAFTYLYNSYAPALFSIICKHIKDQNKTEDVLQEAFCKIWQRIDCFDASKGRLFTWLVNITKNAAIDRTRNKIYKEEQRTFSFSETDGGSYCPYHCLEAKEIRKAVSRMSCKHRNVVELAYFYGFTHEQIAKMLQLPLGTIKSRIRAAYKYLYVLFADEYQGSV